MELLELYLAQAERYRWQPSLAGFGAFWAQVQEGRRKQDGSWRWAQQEEER